MPGKKLLIADDSLTIQKVIRLALSSEGYDIQAVSDGNDAIQQISVFRPDAVLIDVSLPGKTAFEVKRAVNAMGDLAHMRFVLMSSAFEKVDEQQAEQVKFDGRLTKPFDPAHLRLVLTKVLAAQGTTPDLPKIQEYELDHSSQPSASQTDGSSTEIDLSDWSQPLKPMMEFGLPPTPPSSLPPSLPPSFGVPTPPVPPPSQDSGESPSSEESDIKHLTESTIRMSGLDDFEWTVNEPTLKPLPSMSDLDGSSFSFETPPSLPPSPPPVMSPPTLASSSSVGGDAASAYFNAPASPSFSTELPPPATAKFESKLDIEEMVRREVQQALEKMAKSLLPEVAERVIKQEIHRLLNEIN